MIFITLGSQKFQFDRLLRAMDDLAASGAVSHEIFAQTGASTYIPVHFPSKPFLDTDVFKETIRRADIVVTHGGTGAIVNAVKLSKKVIVVPRLACYGEHVDDHQLQIMRTFADLNLVLPCENTDSLVQKIAAAERMTFRSYQSNTHSIVDSIDGYIQEQINTRGR
ncbi:MAG: beta(1,3)galactosyltransferase EpsH [Clostridia bacterium]|nr:beta(1,3)galactosyltransferase EpsH [Clostridia bacterium]